MSDIIVDYNSVENAVPSVNGLSTECEGIKGNVDSVASDIDALSGKHDGCFGATIGVLDMLSGFVTKMGSEYEAIASVANTALGSFNNAEGKITADTEKIADLKWLLVYLGMDRDACNDLDFENVNTGKADISKYEAYYKDTNADLSSSVNSDIADMLLVEDGKGGYKVLTRSEIEEYIREMSKAETSKSAESTYSANSGNTGARSSSSTSSKSSDTDTNKVDGTLEERKDTEEKTKEEEPKTEEESPKTEEQPEEETSKEEEPKTEEEPQEEQPVTPEPEVAQPEPQPAVVVGNPEVPAQQPVSVPSSNVSNIGMSNITPEVGSTVVPESEVPAEVPTPEVSEVPNIENTTPSSSGSRTHSTTIPATTPSSSSSNNSGGSPAKFVFPALGGIAAAGAAGVGAKMYLDKKNGEEETDEIEDYNDYETDDGDYEVAADDYNPNSSIQAPDSSWSMDNNIEENRY